MTPLEIAQQIFSGRWKHASAALEACQRGAWPEFAREVAPRKPLLLGRLDHGRCLELAEHSLTGPSTTKVTLVPLWVCQTWETVSNEWVAVHGSAWEDGRPLEVNEMLPVFDDATPRADALWECSVQRWRAATVVRSENYASSIPLELRAGAYGVLGMDVVEVLAVDVRETEPLPRPTSEVPIFAFWYEPRVQVSPELESRVRAMSYTAPGEPDESLGE